MTGWDPEKYTPYTSGYWSLGQTPNMLGSGCENCHGPGSEHVKAENGDIEADDTLLAQLREQMRLPLEHAHEKCIKCHDLDNSPDFHTGGGDAAAFSGGLQQLLGTRQTLRKRLMTSRSKTLFACSY